MGPNSVSHRAESFLALSSRQDLARWLGLSDRELRYVLYVLPASKKYTAFSVKKRNGSSRTIEAPHPALKQLQRKLLIVLSELAPASGIAKGYVPHRSVIDHAWMHRRRRFVVLADLKDFFPSITFARVRGALLAKPFQLTPAVATCVAQLCCSNSVLPQGAPTSPCLSNLICRSLDHALLRLAKRHRLSVSRYADDICFSTSQPSISPGIATQGEAGWVAGAELREIVESCGFCLNEEKFSVRQRDTAQLVTGLIVNDGVSLPRRWRRQVRALLHLVKKYGEEKANLIGAEWATPPASRQPFSSVGQVIRGKAYYAHYVDRRTGRTFSDSLFRSYPAQRKLLPNPLDGISFRLMAEGKTDLLHLEAAHRALKAAGAFVHMRPRFVDFQGSTGDRELLKTLHRIANSDIPELTVGVFDCDNQSLMQEAGLSPGKIAQIGRRVFAMCLAPTEALSDKLFCIEMLYERRDLCAFSADERRVFLREEFDEQTGISGDDLYKRAYPKKKNLLVEDQVTRISDGHSSLLSKADFANLIHQKSPPFDGVSFDGFAPTFRLIDQIIDLVNEQ